MRLCSGSCSIETQEYVTRDQDIKATMFPYGLLALSATCLTVLRRGVVGYHLSVMVALPHGSSSGAPGTSPG
jgi:hypothetical protein